MQYGSARPVQPPIQDDEIDAGRRDCDLSLFRTGSTGVARLNFTDAAGCW